MVTYREFVTFYVGHDWARVASCLGVADIFALNLTYDMIESEACYHAFINTIP